MKVRFLERRILRDIVGTPSSHMHGRSRRRPSFFLLTSVKELNTSC